ncbi:MAG: molybdopterin converting factor [Chloroflexaceae bacterium]|nr:molybdopterin converting factor [Chloroflexaceae bacterium]
MIHLRVRLFAGHRDIVGASSLVFDLAPGTTAEALWARLVADYPPLGAGRGTVRCAINEEFQDLATELRDNDEVAYIPPVSGGTDQPSPAAGREPAHEVAPFVVTDLPLNPVPLMQWVQTTGDGAVVTFAGVARDHHHGRATAFLAYEAYREMVVNVLARLAEEARTRWDIGRVAIHHRTGRVEVGETAVVVVVAAPHRQPAFAAAAHLMNRIKEVVPIWKREHWSDGTSEWSYNDNDNSNQQSDEPAP